MFLSFSAQNLYEYYYFQVWNSHLLMYPLGDDFLLYVFFRISVYIVIEYYGDFTLLIKELFADLFVNSMKAVRKIWESDYQKGDQVLKVEYDAQIYLNLNTSSSFML